jgi:hypothetical protein
MILPNFVLPSRVGQTWQHSGIDSPDRCLDKKHFESYPRNIVYHYNSRGFRDIEWPDTLDELNSVIWCVGDSFTVGIGSPLEHTWPYQLQQVCQQRIINVSLDGASNQWIAKQVLDILAAFPMAKIIVQWSFLHRRESHAGQQLHHAPTLSLFDDIDLWQRCLELLPNVTHSVIPDAAPGIDRKEVVGWWNNSRLPNWPSTMPAKFEDFESAWIEHLRKQNVLENFQAHFYTSKLMEDHKVIYVQRQPNDLARDGFHYDVKTSQWFVEKLKLIL